MAVGTVSGLSKENWQLIATSTPSGVSSVSFTSLSGYDTYIIGWNQLTLASGSALSARFNDDTGSNYGSTMVYITTNATIAVDKLLLASRETNPNTGYVSITNCLRPSPYPKTVNDLGGWSLGNGSGVWYGGAINKISVFTDYNYTAGTIYLFGVV